MILENNRLCFMYVRLSIWEKSTLAGRIFVKFCSGYFFLKFVDTSQFLLKSDDRVVGFTPGPTYMYDIAPCLVNSEIMHYNVA